MAKKISLRFLLLFFLPVLCLVLGCAGLLLRCSVITKEWVAIGGGIDDYGPAFLGPRSVYVVITTKNADDDSISAISLGLDRVKSLPFCDSLRIVDSERQLSATSMMKLISKVAFARLRIDSDSLSKSELRTVLVKSASYNVELNSSVLSEAELESLRTELQSVPLDLSWRRSRRR